MHMPQLTQICWRMKMFGMLISKARKYLDIAINFLKRLAGIGERVDDALEQAAEDLKKDNKKESTQ